MKTELTTEQSAELIRLGIPPSKASIEIFKNVIADAEGNLAATEPIFNLADMFEILPKWIKYRYNLLWLQMGIDRYEEKWWCEYESRDGIEEDAETYQSDEELIDALYGLLVYCIEEKLITPR